MSMKNFAVGILSAMGGFLVNFVGGVDSVFKALVIFMAVDYITGLLVAFVFHKSKKTPGGGASSKEGFKGIVKKVCMILLVGLAHSLDKVMGYDYLRATTILFFLANEGLSILENIGLTGIKYPKFLKKALEVMRDNAEENPSTADAVPLPLGKEGSAESGEQNE